MLRNGVWLPAERRFLMPGTAKHYFGLLLSPKVVHSISANMESNEIEKTSDITIRVSLDQERVPTRIAWSATDMHESGKMDECKAMAIALFDKEHRDTLRIDLWTKEMQVQEMDRFMYQILRSLSQTYLRATQNKDMAEELAKFAHYFGEKTEIIPK